MKEKIYAAVLFAENGSMTEAYYDVSYSIKKKVYQILPEDLADCLNQFYAYISTVFKVYTSCQLGKDMVESCLMAENTWKGS